MINEKDLQDAIVFESEEEHNKKTSIWEEIYEKHSSIAKHLIHMMSKNDETFFNSSSNYDEKKNWQYIYIVCPEISDFLIKAYNENADFELIQNLLKIICKTIYGIDENSSEAL